MPAKKTPKNIRKTNVDSDYPSVKGFVLICDENSIRRQSERRGRAGERICIDILIRSHYKRRRRAGKPIIEAPVHPSQVTYC